MNKLQPLSYQSTSNIIPRLPLHTSQPTPKIYNATALVTRPYIYAQIYAPTASCSIGKKKILLPTHLGETRKTFTVSEAWRDCFCAVNELMNVPENSVFAVKRVHRTTNQNALRIYHQYNIISLRETTYHPQPML